jgi:4-amino-4-deoxy-L-arabinose transferase-like glycosyltransferase
MTRPLRIALLLVICGVAFWWRLGYLGLIDPDEPFYAQTTREMLQAHDWVTPRIFGQPQFEKPILIYWLSMGSFRLFGPSEFAARVPAALFATILVFMTWAFASRQLGGREGLLSAVVLATAVEFIISARMMLTDMVFAAFVCGSAFSLWFAAREERLRDRWFLAACGLCGLAVLTKGPLGLLLPLFALAALLLQRARPLPARPASIALGLAVFTLIAVPWYAIMLRMYGSQYFDSFFLHENVGRFLHAEHPGNNRPYYYLAVLVGGSIPWMPVLAVLVRRARNAGFWSGLPRYLAAWGLLCLVFFTLAASKLPSYVLFLLVPLSILIGHALAALLAEGARDRAETWAMGALALVQAAAFLIAPRLTPYSVLAWPLGLVGGCLAIAFLLQTWRASVPWVAVSALAAPVLVVACLGWAGPTLDDILSTRTLARGIAGEVRVSEPVMASPILARGVFYYSHHPVTVLSGKARPFYTPHPLPIVVGVGGLVGYLRSEGSALCALTASDWARLGPKLPRNSWIVQDTRGDKVIARLSAAPEIPDKGLAP